MNALTRKCAQAEIARRRDLAEALLMPGKMYADNHVAPNAKHHCEANDPTHVLGVLADAVATLDRHRPRTDNPWDGCDWCSTSEFPVPSPCPDALAVIRRYPSQGPT